MVKSRVNGLILTLVALPQSLRHAIIAGVDLSTCLVSVWLAYWLRMGEWQFLSTPVLIFAAIAFASWIAVAILTRTYRSLVRFSGSDTIIALMRSCAIMCALLAAFLFAARIPDIPRTLSVIHPIVFFLILSVVRVLLARLITRAFHSFPGIRACKRILVYGAGRAGNQLALAVGNEPCMKIVGFLDDEPTLGGRMLAGKPIWHVSKLEIILVSEEIDEVFLAIPSARRSVRRTIIERIRKANGSIRVRVLPTVSQLASDRVTINDLREVQIEELLGRDEVPPDDELMSKNVLGRRVLVTGAGGSIGSELCRQIVRQRPSALILVEQSEHALYRIELELRDLQGREILDGKIQTALINVAAENECERLFARFRPETVFHAAAYKHVPLVEANPIAGIRNNAIGTLNACVAAERSGTRNFILVSTDKAVRPTNVMGASKRICEMIIQARAAAQTGTSYIAVRFGNVLGSSGSVVPRFKEQIAAGGPVTVTHPDATRYFMTISEAAQLVVQAGALAEDGEVLLLDMGKPVRIADLARAMIELSGLSVADEENPDGDIAITQIGLRPGEKMIEELLIDAASEGTIHPRIIKGRESMLPWSKLHPELTKLKSALAACDTQRTLELVKRLVPHYRPEQAESRIDSPSEVKMPLRLVSTPPA
ncbi:MAG: polysaccharide biosynthesis protein [Sphingomonas sp.]|nr:polysaccharide biosynthesis protein [Sphingomonas sp.]